MTKDMQQNPVDLHNIINQIIDNDNNTHVINNNIPETLIIIGDDFYLISLFQNLLDNAKKYSPKESTINFYIENHVNKVILCVSDEGIGIADNEKLKIFDRFYRIEDEETRNYKGTGLGLFLVDQIAKDAWREKLFVKTTYLMVLFLNFT